MCRVVLFVFFKQKTAYEMRISDWSSDVCSSDLWGLTSPKDNAVIRKVRARDLWVRILTARIETGEPYIIYGDHVNRQIPQHHKLAGLTVKMSNLCSEITLPTGKDHHGAERTAVCCLSSLNLEKYFEWQDDATFIRTEERR